ncbi:methyltransferase domain-containing protein [Solicola gregarius]|uniref:Methyltransferase domain-containing protein n=1 Tax=Solicola gregarius TaxID=2908642 RepID=A0AA46YKC6_9ACTN|nr:methyltransferase domain-containing protein [Solicola gregarius]UYM05367.1 methyltransferase domain-containing protein [Solicola gregarius]
MSESPPSDLGHAALRTAVVWDAVRDVVAELADAKPLEIVDVGGGTGGLAVRVAELGHRVVVIDPSPNALASLHRRAADTGVEQLVRGVQGDAADLGGVVADSSADLVLCHGVLDVVDEPARALERIHIALRPGGVLSVVVPGRAAGVLARALAGQFERARALLDAQVDDWRPDEHGPRRFTPTEVELLLTEGGFDVERVDATRVFSDLIPSALVDGEPGARRALLDLERAVATRPEFESLAGHLHALARRT